MLASYLFLNFEFMVKIKSPKQILLFQIKRESDFTLLTLFPLHVFCKVPFDTRFNYLLTLIQSLESLQITQSVKNNEKMTQIAAIANISTFAFHFIPNMISLLWSKQQAVI